MLALPMRLAPILLLSLAACQPVELGDRASEPPRNDTAVVVEGGTPLSQGLGMIDGDTFRLNGEVIRISNIDAPEMPPRSRCWAEARLARAATMELQRIQGEGTPGGLRITREGQDRYRRTLARVSYDGGRTDAGETMIARGMASPWTGRRWDWCAAVSNDPNGAAIVHAPASPIASMLEANR